jgi:hypothetical protein
VRSFVQPPQIALPVARTVHPPCGHPLSSVETDATGARPVEVGRRESRYPLRYPRTQRCPLFLEGIYGIRGHLWGLEQLGGSRHPPSSLEQGSGAARLAAIPVSESLTSRGDPMQVQRAMAL